MPVPTGTGPTGTGPTGTGTTATGTTATGNTGTGTTGTGTTGTGTTGTGTGTGNTGTGNRKFTPDDQGCRRSTANLPASGTSPGIHQRRVGRYCSFFTDMANAAMICREVKKHGPPKLIGRFDELSRCVIISPQCPRDSWWRTATLKALIDETVASRDDIDRSRLYVTGLSMGGYGIWSFVIEASRLLCSRDPNLRRR